MNATSLGRESRLQRLKDNLITLQHRYGELLKSVQMGTAVQQQMGTLQSLVTSQSIVSCTL